MVVALMCVGYFGCEDDAALHIAPAVALLALLALEIAVLRRWHSLSRFPARARDLRVAPAGAHLDHLGRDRA